MLEILAGSNLVNIAKGERLRLLERGKAVEKVEKKLRKRIKYGDIFLLQLGLETEMWSVIVWKRR